MVKKKKELNKISSLISFYFNLKDLNEIVDLERSNQGLASSGIALSLYSKKLGTVFLNITKKEKKTVMNIFFDYNETHNKKEIEVFFEKLKKSLKVKYIDLSVADDKINSFTMKGIKESNQYFQKIEIKGFFNQPFFASLKSIF